MGELYLLVVLIITIIFLSPFFLKIQKIGFNVYTFFAVAVLVQVFLRNILMYFDIPNYDYVHTTLLLNKPWEDFIFSALIFLLGSILTVLSYIFAYKSCSHHPSPLRVIAVNPSYRSIKVWSYILITISIFSLLSYLSIYFQPDGFLSSYRGVSNTLEGYTASGGLRVGIKLSFVVALLSIAYYWDFKKKIFLLLFLSSTLLYLFFAFYTSSRGSILTFIIANLAMLSFYNKLTKFKLFYAFCIVVFIGVVMTLLRLDYAGEFVFNQVFDSFYKAIAYIVVNNGGIDIPKFHHLIEYVQRESDYRYGGFLSNIILLLIPRAIWPGKPVNIDTEFGFSVYGSLSYGSGAVPPGIYGEFFWDFSWIGFVFAAILAGILLGFLDRFLRSNLDSIFVKVAYSLTILWAGMGLMGSGFVSYFIGFSMLVIPLYIVFYISSYSYKLK